MAANFRAKIGEFSDTFIRRAGIPKRIAILLIPILKD